MLRVLTAEIAYQKTFRQQKDEFAACFCEWGFGTNKTGDAFFRESDGEKKAFFIGRIRYRIDLTM
jgi:hypothetical protein